MNRHSKRKYKVTKVEGLPPAQNKLERAMSASPVFANPYGKRVSAGNTFKKLYDKKLLKVPYSSEGTKCKTIKGCEGVLRNTQWNRLVCSKCNYSELV
jgi:hypothetical protein